LETLGDFHQGSPKTVSFVFVGSYETRQVLCVIENLPELSGSAFFCEGPCPNEYAIKSVIRARQLMVHDHGSLLLIQANVLDRGTPTAGLHQNWRGLGSGLV
jgi:hypothetical protein